MSEDLDALLSADAGGTDVDLTELLEQVITVALEKMAGPVVGKVEMYTASTQRASVTPLVPLLIDGAVVIPPTLPAVPVCWPDTGAHAIKWPLPTGALVQLEPEGHDHSQWFTSGAPNIPPPSERRFSLADLVAKPLAPSPFNTAANPLTFDAVWAVLFGAWAVGGSDATKAVALNGDAVNKSGTGAPPAGFAGWMQEIETLAMAGGGGIVTNAASTITQIGTVAATATKLKAK